ncbi:hypothetical protein, partial [Marinovum sp. 1_MG-2023]|uniref:hypothetical protein n=1 Tax=Marinovum sp. 1_MG-2023 TaxID=3062633 RepID=UPI0026E2852D
VLSVTLMPLLPGRSTWLKQLACHDEVQLKIALIKRDKHPTQGRQIQTITTKITARLPTK